MEYEIKRDCIQITIRTEQDKAFIADTLGLPLSINEKGIQGLDIDCLRVNLQADTFGNLVRIRLMKEQ